MVKCAVVLPAGTGKTFMTGKGLGPWVYEADSVCHPRETAELDELRTNAKSTGNWIQYDQVYGSILLSRLPSQFILLIGSAELAASMRLSVYYTLVLRRDLWIENMVSRGQIPDKHVDNYNIALKAADKIFNDRDAMYQFLRDACLKRSDWF